MRREGMPKHVRMHIYRQPLGQRALLQTLLDNARMDARSALADELHWFGDAPLRAALPSLSATPTTPTLADAA